MISYTRNDGEVMVQMEHRQHEFVNQHYAETYGLVKVAAQPKGNAPSRTIPQAPSERKAGPPLNGETRSPGPIDSGSTKPLWTEPASVVVKRKGGRPVGSKNKPKVVDAMWPFDDRQTAAGKAPVKRKSKAVLTH